MLIDGALDRLYSLQKFGVKLGLNNIRNLLEYLGNPQDKFQSFHIAGTNGKGSTSSFIASILKEAGYKTGLYTSPHFIRFNERIRINGIEIPDDYIAGFVNSLEKYIDENRPTFFEVTTALAFNYFAENQIDYAVIEVGLGGRLDATNVINPAASVITSISLEHTEILGNSLSKIAEEKAGIIKQGSTVFIGSLPGEAQEKVIERCNDFGNKYFIIDDYIKNSDNKLRIDSTHLQLEDINVPLKGFYQKYNAALALLTVSETIPAIEISCIISGLNNVVYNTGISGRYEIYNENPCVIFDSAHNPDGIKNFLSAFEEESNKFSKKYLLFGAMQDKAIKEMLEYLSLYFDKIHFTSIENERCASLENLISIGNELNLNTFVIEDAAEFITSFISNNKNDCLVVLGSMYILGYIKEKMIKKNLDIFS